jgi:hypothetical protein
VTALPATLLLLLPATLLLLLLLATLRARQGRRASRCRLLLALPLRPPPRAQRWPACLRCCWPRLRWRSARPRARRGQRRRCCWRVSRRCLLLLLLVRPGTGCWPLGACSQSPGG